MAPSAMTADTIFALSSGRPPAAVSVIRVSGMQARAAGMALAGTLPEPRRAAVRTLRDRTGAELDEALVLRFDRPASATGEDVVEFQCHGGRAVVDAVLSALAEIEGLRAAEPGEFTRRAFENRRIDLTEAEGLADLIEAETESQRRAALAAAEGGLRRQIEQWQQALVALSGRAEAAIDYVGEDDVGADDALNRECGALALELADWLARPRVEPLKDGVRVVLAGPPNSGKSSLVNAIVGSEKVIVTDIPGTTRDTIEVPLALAGIPLRLTDTAGLRRSVDTVEQIGIARAEQSIVEADILLWLGAPDAAPEHPRLILVQSKCDILGRAQPPGPEIPVSAVTGAGLTLLLERVAEVARSVVPAEDALALNRRQANHVDEARAALAEAAAAADLVIIAELLRAARAAFDRLTGRAGVEDVLDALFGRFCLGK